jgi:flagellar motility protein MotE (MotC chaperone)
VADEDVTDLTDDDESGAEPKGKQKKVKAPKPPKAPKKEKEPKEKKVKEKKVKEKKESSGGSGGLIVIMSLVLILLIGGFTVALVFDVFSARVITADVITEPLIDVIIWLNPSYSSISNRLEAERVAQEIEFEERTDDLDEREAQIELLENVLITQEQLLDRRALELDRREEQIIAMYERTIPIYRREMTEQELADMNSLSRTYTQMAPEAAADIIVELYDPRDVAAIIYFMGERNAAAILAVMEPDYAANITEILLYS